MSSITITSIPEDGATEIPREVQEQLVGLELGLCSPQDIIFIGCENRLGEGDIVAFHNAYAVSWESFIIELKRQRPRLAEWFRKQYPYERATPNGTILLFGESCCEYNP